MTIKLTVISVFEEADYAVAKCKPTMIDPRTGDDVSGELFITTSPDNRLERGKTFEFEIVAVIPVPAEEVPAEPVV